jgi:hypothetical protein
VDFNGRFAYYRGGNSGISQISEVSFHASYQKSSHASNSLGYGLVLDFSSGAPTLYLRNDNISRCISGDVASVGRVAIYWRFSDTSFNPEFLTFIDCEEYFIVFNYFTGELLPVIQSSNFIGNVVTEGVIFSVSGGFPIQNCIFQGNSASKAFSGASISNPFLVSNCCFDDFPGSSSYWTQSGSSNYFYISTATHSILPASCLSAFATLKPSRTPLPSPSHSPSCRPIVEGQILSRLIFSGTCDVVVRLAIFQQLTSSESGGAIYDSLAEPQCFIDSALQFLRAT